MRMRVLVIGGGIIGSAVAWRLAGERAQVIVLERGRAGLEASWAAAGVMAPQAEADEAGPLLRLCIEGKRAFESILDSLIEESGIDPEYDRRGVIYVALTPEERATLVRRAQT